MWGARVLTARAQCDDFCLGLARSAALRREFCQSLPSGTSWAGSHDSDSLCSTEMDARRIGAAHRVDGKVPWRRIGQEGRLTGG